MLNRTIEDLTENKQVKACDDKAQDSKTVSVVIPCFNEEHSINQTLENLVGQYKSELYEIIVVDGKSTDRTRDIIKSFAERRSEMKISIVENPARNIPTALNLGIGAATGEIIVRMDAHSVPSSGYVRRCVELLTSGEISVVGMPWLIKPGKPTLVARTIAAAVAHPFGIGDAKYRLKVSEPQFVDTVPFGAFNKSLWKELGGFNEELLTNEDYDFNYRVRSRGGQVLLDSAEHSDYFARSTLSELAAQYSRYGLWKAQMVKLHPRSIKLRHLAAPTLVLSILTTAVAGFFWSFALWLLALLLATYLFLSLLAGWNASKKSNLGFGGVLVMPLVFATLHLSWGASFIIGLFRTRKSCDPIDRSDHKPRAGG
jgi:succinoglycan biosynthesis protein ExoA